MAKYEIMAEMNLKKITDESRDVAQALNEFADNLERIEKKYDEENYEMIDLGNGLYEKRRKLKGKEQFGTESENEGTSEISETEIKAMTKEQNYICGYKDGKFIMLEKIRAEIEEYKSRQLTLAIGVDDLEKGKQTAIEYALEIIDKYKTESEATDET